MSAKYEFTDEEHPTRPKMRRIRSLRDIPDHDVRAGDLGGWIENEDNLSHDGACWVSESAEVSDDARVIDDAKITTRARIVDEATISGNAWVGDTAIVSGEAKVSDYAVVCGAADVSGNAQVFDDAVVDDHVQVFGQARIRDKAMLTGTARVFDDAEVGGSAYVTGTAQVHDAAVVGGKARVEDATIIRGHACVNDEIDSGDDGGRVIETTEEAFAARPTISHGGVAAAALARGISKPGTNAGSFKEHVSGEASARLFARLG